MVKITSAEFQKRFEQYQTEAYERGLIISDCDSEDLALISAEEYNRLRKQDHQAFYAHELPSDILDEMGD